MTAESHKHGPIASRCRNRGRQAWRLHAVLEFTVDFLIIVLISGLTETKKPMSGSHTVTGRLSLGTCVQAIRDVKLGTTGLIGGVFPKEVSSWGQP